MDLLVLSATLFTSSPVKGFFTHKKKSLALRRSVMKWVDFTDGSHIYKMDFWGYKRMFLFLRAFLKNELNMNAQVGSL